MTDNIKAHVTKYWLRCNLQIISLSLNAHLSKNSKSHKGLELGEWWISQNIDRIHEHVQTVFLGDSHCRLTWWRH